MCAGAIVQSRMKKVVIATMNPKAGCAGSVLNLLQMAAFNHQVEIEKSHRQLADGDFVVLVSDGVMDYLHVPDPEETIREMLETMTINNPGQMAKHILERILLFTGGRVPDDMTVLAAGIWER